MKPLIPILVVATTSLAVASVQFAQQASAQRERADAEMTLRLTQEARVVELERTQARLERELMATAGTAGAPPPVVEAPKPSSTRPAAPANGSIALAEASGDGDRKSPFQTFRRPLGQESPATRKFMQSRVKASMRRMHADAGEALGLSQEKANQLIDLLAEQQARNIGRSMQASANDPTTMRQYFEEQQQKNQAEISALIGQDKMNDWTAYQKSLPDRMQVNQVQDQLDGSGVPMTSSQREQMLAAISEERDRYPQPTYSQGLPAEEMQAQMTQWQNDYQEALLKRAKNVLSTEQFNVYKEYHDWQTEMRNSFPRGAFGRTAAPAVSFGTGNAVIPAAPPGMLIQGEMMALPPPAIERR